MKRILAIFALTASIASAQGSPTFQKVFTSATTAQASSAVRNSGQAVHILTVMFLSATADVSSFNVRIEASLNPSDGSPVWFPISEDVTAATYITTSGGNFAYSITRANGVYPAVRVRYVTAHASLPLTAYYSGGQHPIGTVRLENGRYVASQSTAQDRATWVLCAGADCETGTDLTNVWIATRAMTVTKCYGYAKTAPTGSALTVDINKSGAGSIFSSVFSISAGANSASSTAIGANGTLAEGDRLTIDIDAIGSGTAGQDLTITCTLQ